MLLGVLVVNTVNTNLQQPLITNSLFTITGFTRSWKIIEYSRKINFLGKSWKIDKNVKVLKKLKNH